VLASIYRLQPCRHAAHRAAKKRLAIDDGRRISSYFHGIDRLPQLSASSAAKTRRSGLDFVGDLEQVAGALRRLSSRDQVGNAFSGRIDRRPRFWIDDCSWEIENLVSAGARVEDFLFGFRDRLQSGLPISILGVLRILPVSYLPCPEILVFRPG